MKHIILSLLLATGGNVWVSANNEHHPKGQQEMRTVRSIVSRATLCTNDCQDSNDGWCDDGGMGAEFDVCDLGTDCADCQTRTVNDPPPSPPPCRVRATILFSLNNGTSSMPRLSMHGASFQIRGTNVPTSPICRLWSSTMAWT